MYISSYAHTLSPLHIIHTYIHTHTLSFSHTGTYREPQSSTSLTNPSALEPEGGGGGGEGGSEEIDPTQDEMERERLMAKAEQVCVDMLLIDMWCVHQDLMYNIIHVCTLQDTDNVCNVIVPPKVVFGSISTLCIHVLHS